MLIKLSTLVFAGLLLALAGIFSQVHAQVVINEVMVDPVITVSDTSEWIEFYNYSEEDIDLSGWSINGAAFPAGQVIPSQGYLIHTHNLGELVNEFGEPPVSVPVVLMQQPRLTNTGLTLSLKNGTELVDEISYSLSSPGISWERTGPFCNELVKHPNSHTMGNMNMAATPVCFGLEETSESIPSATHLLISELYPSPNTGENEWVEIYNYGNAAISLDGWRISDLVRSEPLSGQVPAGGYLVFEVGPVTLNNTGDTITLISPADQEIDQVIYPSIARGSSYARTLTTQGYTLEFTIAPETTPGAPNANVASAEQDSEIEPETEEDEAEVKPGQSGKGSFPYFFKPYKFPYLWIKPAKSLPVAHKVQHLPIWPGFAATGGSSFCWLMWNYGIFKKMTMFK